MNFFSNWIATAVTLTVCASFSSVNAHDTGAAQLEEFGKDIFLVQAQVVGISRADRKCTISLQPTHVYSGSDVEGAKPFTAIGTEDGENYDGRRVYPVPGIGESGLWLVRTLKDGTRYATAHDDLFTVEFPARQGICDRYHEVSSLARVVESVYRAAAPRDVQVLHDGMSSGIPEVVAWSIRSYATVAPDDVLKIRDLVVADKARANVGFVEADKVLCASHYLQWVGSADRPLFSWVGQHCPHRPHTTR